MNQTPPSGVEAHPEIISAIIKASESHSIIASQDIVDIRGLKLWAKGLPVSSTLQHRLLERKLQRPLESCLAVQDGVTVFTLYDQLQAFLDESTPLAIALRPAGLDLLKQVKQLPLHSVAQLMLTTAAATRPDTLPHALQAMALAGAMSQGQRKMPDVRLAMLGGLLHDIGEVYMQPMYLDPANVMDLEGHKHLVVHPRVAQLLLSTTTDYPGPLCLAIGEHHERQDGSGYPARLMGDAISPLGRLLAVMEVTLGILRAPRGSLQRASFALRVVPGEFDPAWTSFVCTLAQKAQDEAPEPPAAPLYGMALPVAQIDQRLQVAQQLSVTLREQGLGAATLSIVDMALRRLGRLRVAWNALGAWGVGSGPLSKKEQFELDMANRELQRHLRDLERECLLLAERLGEVGMDRLEPLWHNLLDR
jgi:hypothetical protein